MAINFKNTVYYPITGVADTVPASSTGTGTMAVTGKGVIGTGTAFKTELERGSWIVDFAQGEIRKVTDIDSDGLAYIDKPFSLNIAASTALTYIKHSDLNMKELSIYADSTDAVLDGETLQANVGVDLGKSGNSRQGLTSFIDPVIVDATGTVVYVLILR